MPRKLGNTLLGERRTIAGRSTRTDGINSPTKSTGRLLLRTVAVSGGIADPDFLANRQITRLSLPFFAIRTSEF